MIRHMLALAGLLTLAAPAQVRERPGAKWTVLERIARPRLEATAQARRAFAAARRDLAPIGAYQEYRAVMHVHAEDSAHTGGTHAEALAAAQATGTRAVLLTGHGGAKPGAWQGLHEGVLFIAGGEQDNTQAYPGLVFHAHPEEQPQRDTAAMAGMEIYNRHADAVDDKDLLAYLKRALQDPQVFADLKDLQRQYPDELFGAGCDAWPDLLARWDAVLAKRHFTGVAANDAHQNTVLAHAQLGKILLDPYAVSFRNLGAHILARELSAEAVTASLREGRVFLAHDWLADATGFRLWASNNLGVYEMGDTIPLLGTTNVTARAPLAAHLKLIHNGQVVAEARDAVLRTQIKEPGYYRVEAWLEVDGEERAWIYSNPVYAAAPGLALLRLPPAELKAGVEARRDIVYVEGKPEDAEKHKLDVYRPAGAKNLPVLLFLHGGAWRGGDRKQYPAFGNRFAPEGFVVTVPSYRLAPANPLPAAIEDAAAAFAWTVRNIAGEGGDPRRIYLAGHSAGAHLAALLAANPVWLKPHGLETSAIRGVLGLSGPYDILDLLRTEPNYTRVFGAEEAGWRAASPLAHARSGLPPFLLTWAQWDYLRLAQHAAAFGTALTGAGNRVTVRYVPGENHLSEMTRIDLPDNAMVKEMLAFLRAEEKR